MSLNLLVSLALSAIGFYVVKLFLSRQRRPGPLPPGPKPKPVLGNLSDLPPPGTQEWKHWLNHKDVYGPVSSITVMGQTIVILNDVNAANELLVRRSAKYSSRPNLVFASEMAGWEHITAMQKSTPRLRAYRKAMQPYIGSESAVAQYNSLQEVEAHRFLFRVLEDQGKLSEHIQTEAGAIILKIAYGYTIGPHERDLLVHISNVAMDDFSKAATPGAWLVDIIPALKYVPAWLPGAGFKRTAQAWKKDVLAMADIPYAFVTRQMQKGHYQPSYLSNLFKEAGHPAPGTEDELVAKWTAASLYAGGADTTVSAIETFFLAMTLHPEVQRNAQKEIDRVLGPCQLPTVADRPRLPYIDAVVKEVLRWHPVGPMGIPHESSEDDMWGPYFIPKGSVMLPNIWAMTHDPACYPEPEIFNPDRFLATAGHEPEPDPHNLVFGFGRRVCPARALADVTVYLTVARSLAVFDIKKAVENGKEVDVEPKFLPGVVSHPEAWRFHIEPRSAAHEALIRSVEEKAPWEKSNAADLVDDR
ncbi:hypothetical protein N7535_007709 [Penicillium sp. DV-2018c]|nr:hypothetical protein N7461_003741 [Penicillium sp. DV-2018c]KAJ5566071.1 hypothetical protein N7535_007709 [Penicillium sp. DV-2018c]